MNIPEVIDFEGLSFKLVKHFADANKADSNKLQPIMQSVIPLQINNNNYSMSAVVIGNMPEDNPNATPRMFYIMGFSRTAIKILTPQILQGMNIYELDYTSIASKFATKLIEYAKVQREPEIEVTGDPIAYEDE